MGVRQEAWKGSTAFADTLKTQGISYKDPLNVLSAPLLSTYIRGVDATIFIAGIDYPFKGQLFAFLFNQAAPTKTSPGSEASSGLSDFAVPYMIKHHQTTNHPYYRDYPRLHRVHSQDPHIGPVYDQFVDQHLDKWMQNMGGLSLDNADDVFDIVSHLFFFQGGQDMISRVQQKLDQDLYPYEFLGSVLQFKNREFKNFLAEQPEFQNAPNLQDDTNFQKAYNETTTAKDRDYLLRKYLATLDEVGRAAVLKHYALHRENKIFVDLLDRKVYDRSGDISQESIRVLDPNSITITDPKGNTAKLTVFLKDNQYCWQATETTFTPAYRKKSLYPVIAWMNTLYGRRFLTQIEWEEIAKYTGWFHRDQDDVFLGKGLVCYLSPGISSQWPDTMRLAQSHVDMKIGVAQTAVWMSLKEHEEQLLSDKNPLITTLEHIISQ